MMTCPDISSQQSLLTGSKVQKQIEEIFLKKYPNEACAFVMPGGEVFEVDNVHENPKDNFRVDRRDVDIFMPDCLAFVHSHPDQAELYLSEYDMKTQVAFNKTFGVANVTEGYCRDTVYWGSDIATPSLIGRPFRHGPSGSDGKGDCYALIKDFYEIEECVILPEFPRDWEWWQTKDLYRDGISKAGFVPIEAKDVKRGDVFLSQIKSPVPNHGGIYMGNGTVLQHYVGRLSGRTSFGPWARYVTHWLRYEEDNSARSTS